VVTVARSVEQVESLRDAWTSLGGDNVRTDLDYFLWSLIEDRKVIRPHVLSVESEGRTEAILVARLLGTRLPSKLGYWTLYAPPVRAISVLHDGLLGRADSLVAAAILEDLLSSLERREADVVLFRRLACGSALARAATTATTFATRQHNEHSELRWLVELAPTFDEYLASLSSKTRKSARHTANRLERTFGARLSIRSFRGSGDLDVFIHDAERVAVKTYQRRLGVGYSSDRGQVAHLEMLAKHGWFRGHVLYLDGEPIAFELGELYGGRFRSLAGAYDPSYARHRVGAHLQMKQIEDLARDSVSIFDFGIGDAEYKRKLAHTSVEETDVVLYARRPRTIWINLARSTLLGISRATEAVLNRLGLLERLEQRRRQPR
jgi:CelD/BcsL family acetyltransferase involved in cellulose biosynthesis